MIFCKRFNQEMPGLNEPPLFGPLGEVIKQHVSADAWHEWLEVQMKIINEERLDLSEESSQARLFKQMCTFLNLEGLDLGL
jgi:Fe-S cluster biosynthesis and repair protein YggX